jgi:hypothetical protein
VKERIVHNPVCHLSCNRSRAGEAITSVDGIDISFLAAPPISTLLDQELIETSIVASDGTAKKSSYLEQTLYAIACAVNENELKLFSLQVTVDLASPTAGMSLLPVVVVAIISH